MNMTINKQIIKVAVLALNAENVKSIIDGLKSDSAVDFKFVDIIIPSESIIEDVRNADIDLLITDSNLGEFSVIDIIDQLISEIPGIPIVAILQDSSPNSAQQVMLAGARAFLLPPISGESLLSSLRRVDQITRPRFDHLHAVDKQPPSPEELAVFTVYSSQGGAGCSTIATNLAIALQKRTGSKVLLLGGDLFFGQTEVLLNVNSGNSIAELVPHSDQLDQTLIKNVVIDHSSGIDVLLEPSDIQIAQGIRPEEIVNIIEELKKWYDYIVIDAGNAINEVSITLLDIADRIVFLSIPELNALRNLRKFMDLSSTLSYDAGKTLYVLNKSGIRGGINAHEIQRNLSIQFFTEIPDDQPKPTLSINRGIPLMLKYPNSEAGKAISKLAEQIINHRG
jgi:pilus assembly protein CpaE